MERRRSRHPAAGTQTNIGVSSRPRGVVPIGPKCPWHYWSLSSAERRPDLALKPRVGDRAEGKVYNLRGLGFDCGPSFQRVRHVSFRTKVRSCRQAKLATSCPAL